MTIPNSVTTIKNGAFSDCSNLTSVTIPNSVTDIGEWAFSGCISLISVNIPYSVTSIEEGTFYNCSDLISVSIPNSVTSIGQDIYAFCNNLAKVYCYAEIVPLTSTAAFRYSNYQNATLYVPAKSLNAYKTTLPWSSFGTILAICNMT